MELQYELPLEKKYTQAVIIKLSFFQIPIK